VAAQARAGGVGGIWPLGLGGRPFAAFADKARGPLGLALFPPHASGPVCVAAISFAFIVIGQNIVLQFFCCVNNKRAEILINIVEMYILMYMFFFRDKYFDSLL